MSVRPASFVIGSIILILAVVSAFPLVWMNLSSFKTPAESMQTPPIWIPNSLDFGAYREVSGVIDAGRSLLIGAGC